MIATSLPHSWRAVRIGGAQPLSAVLPAVLRQYGLQMPPDAAPPDAGPSVESCGGFESTSAVCVGVVEGLPGCPASGMR